MSHVEVFEESLTSLYYPDHLRSQETLTLQTIRLVFQPDCCTANKLVISDMFFIITE